MDETLERANIESPLATYVALLQQHRDGLAIQQKQDKYLVYGKVALGLLAVSILVWYVHELHGVGMLLVSVSAIMVLAVVHQKVLRQIHETEKVIAYYERALARLQGRWPGTAQGGERFLDPMHPYARDLDLFGRGSIFELLCTFRTRAGEETLASWLLEPAQINEIRARQTAAQELMPRTDFRERLFTAGDKARLGLRPDLLANWGEQQPLFRSRWLPLIAAVLAALWVASLSYGLLRSSYAPLLLISVINHLVNRRIMKGLDESVETVEAATKGLDLLVEILRILEQEKFNAPRLAQLQSTLQGSGLASSAVVRKLGRIVYYLEQRRNAIFSWFGLDGFLFYTAQCMFKAESWRSRYGPIIRSWLNTVGELEALAALSGYAFEHPDDSWPEFSDEYPLFEAESLAHPFLPETNAVRNDLKLGEGLQLVVLSGPNMSGKSTFVRGIGVNAVLAQCGAPVRAKRLRMSRLAVGASICVLDSLQGGVSRFYAEIKRLKMISDMAQGATPVLFLLDELLSGTNSHDRLEGTKLIVDALVQRGAFGLVTTHDLALARIPESMNGRARNYHFEDHFENGQLAFDFKLKTGVVQTSNALKLMQSIGLVSE